MRAFSRPRDGRWASRWWWWVVVVCSRLCTVVGCGWNGVFAPVSCAAVRDVMCSSNSHGLLFVFLLQTNITINSTPGAQSTRPQCPSHQATSEHTLSCCIHHATPVCLVGVCCSKQSVTLASTMECESFTTHSLTLAIIQPACCLSYLVLSPALPRIVVGTLIVCNVSFCESHAHHHSHNVWARVGVCSHACSAL